MLKGKMKQAWLMGKGGPWGIKEVPIPEPGPGEVLIKMKASSICNQTDLNTIRALHVPHDHQMMGMLPHHFRIWDKRIPDELSDVYPKRQYPREPYPTTMGHEGMGVIAKVGPTKRVEKDKISHSESAFFGAGKLELGDRVASIGTIGGFGEYVISEPNVLVKVPDNVSDEEASLLEPACLVGNIVERVVSMGDTVCILGQGALGLLATQYSKINGASKIIVSEPIAFKRELAKKFGADITIDPSTKNVVHEIEELTDGRGADVIIEAAGVPETIRIIPYIAGFGARVGQIGACCVPVLVDWSYIHFKGMDTTSVGAGVFNGNMNKIMQKTINNIMSAGKLDLKSMITHRYKLEDIEKAFKDVESGMVVKVMFIFE